MSALSDGEITNSLAKLPGWARDGDAITKEFTLDAFMDAIGFVDRIAKRAEAANHHPDIEIHYDRVLVSLTTHDAGGISQKDFDLAGEIDACA